MSIDYSFIFDIILGFHALLVTVLTLRILWRHNLTPAARLAWFILILVIPYLGVVIYWLFGEVNLSKNSFHVRQQIIDTLQKRHPEVLGTHSHFIEDIDQKYVPAFAFATSAEGFKTTIGNHATLMPDAQTARQRMIEDFDAATDHIHVLYYIWLNDSTGTNTAHALIRAAKRGVTCRAMVDALGSRKFIKSSLWQQMQEAGVQLETALPLTHIFKTLLFSRIDLRNHRKITIIDGKITYCGSQNCADPEFRVKAKYAPWVDIMMRFEGPVVAQNQMLFASDWLVQRPDTPSDAFVYHTEPLEQGFPAQVFGDGPSIRRDATPQLFCTLIAQAREQLTISTPYFVPDYTLINAICAAAYRGVDVTIIFPKRNDSFVVALTSRSYYRQLLEAGVHIFEYRGGLLHAKTLTIDNTITFIGSTNMDLRSFNLNYENNIILSDKESTQAVIKRQSDYIADSDKVTLDMVLQWGFFRQISYNVVATIGPIL
ncbi:cardiolipin synthase [Psychrobacter sp. I-STPA6b]|uniref:cardiolipin synthase n=1 Tax=Psychrobacter sp. I-STPA6b TaxID=2585718 RepID=UPI002222D44C|nr:cardiolipin synthase [Psychrobacter sp. I-STPA6b]